MYTTPSCALRRIGLSLLAALPLTACGAVRSVAAAPEKVSQAVFPGERAPQPRPLAELHHTVLRFADFAARSLRAATDEFAANAGTPQARIQALEWRLKGSRLAFNAATGPVPLENMLDLLLQTIGGRVAMERQTAPEAWGDAARPVLAALVDIERRAWSILEEFHTREQVANLREVASAWEQRRRAADEDFGSELPTFDEVLATLKVDTSAKSGRMSFIQLDPLAGLEPAARELALSRQFAERTLFWAQRLPMLVEDELQIAVARTQQQPEVVGVLADAARVSNAADSLARTAAGLPDQLRAEREAAIGQLSAELSAQREGLVRDLATSQAPLESLLAQSRETFQAAQGMSSEVAEAVSAVDRFMGRFDRPAPGVGAEPEEPGKPFDIAEYGAAATDVGKAASELRQLVTTLDTSLPQVEQMLGAGAAQGDALIDHAFRRGLQLGLALVAAAALAALLVRLATARLSRKTA